MNDATENTRTVETQAELSARARVRVWLKRPGTPYAIMALILLVGAYLRLNHLNWDLGTHVHPDENFLTMVASAMQLPPSLKVFFDSTTSPMNPYNNGFGLFVYGTLPIFIVRVLAEIANHANQAIHFWMLAPGIPVDLTSYGAVYAVGRVVSALFDLGSIWLTFVLGRRLYGVKVGLLAAAFYTFTAFALQQSHFYTVDTPSTFLALLTLYCAVRVAQGGEPGHHGGGWGTYIALGASLGASIASRINLAPLAGIALLAAGIRAWDDWRVLNRNAGQGDGERTSQAVLVGMLLQATLFRLLLMGLVATAVFRIAQPYAFGGTNLLDFSFASRWLDNMREISRSTRLEVESPPAHQWANRTPFVFPFVNMVVWGMGLPLGLAAWAGWLVATWQVLRALTLNRDVAAARPHILVVAWIGGMFLWQGMQPVVSMRYLLPLYPLLALTAAWLLLWLVDRAQLFRDASAWMQWRPGDFSPLRKVLRSFAPLLPGLAYGLLVLVTVSTILWGWGFLAIYRQPMTRIAASRWIYANIPAGSTIGIEDWDEGLPLGIDGRSGYGPGGYFGLRSGQNGAMPMAWDDIPEKREGLYNWLDEADYLIISSNRRWASAPRMPLRFPMTIEYYRRLFEGKLGFKLIYHNSSFITVLGHQFDDNSAEEAFSVYDHPQVFVFQKTPEYSEALVRSYLDKINLEQVIPQITKQVSQAPTALMLTPDEAARQRAGGTWTNIFDEQAPQNRSQAASTIVWLLLLELLGLAAFPLTFVVLRGLGDRGYGVSKTLGILVLAWLSWIGPSLKLVPYERWWIALCLGLFIGASGITAWRRRAGLVRFVRQRAALLITEEAIFLVLFLLFLLIRIGNPDLWHPARGGEKPMDFAYLNAVIRSTVFPPYDPWHAGGFINYYYFGFVIVGTLIKLTGIVPWVAYNLAVPTLFALTGLGAFSVAFNLADGDGATEFPGEEPAYQGLRIGSLLAGLAGTFFVAIAGNLGNARLLAEQIAQRSTAQVAGSGILAGLLNLLSGGAAVLTGKAQLAFPNDWWFWNASRTIPDTINEFPFFTFTYADLHAHMIALPLTLLALAAAIALVRTAHSTFQIPDSRSHIAEPSPWRVPLAELLLLLLLGFVLGALRATNTWDFPTYALVGLIAISVLEFVRRCGGEEQRSEVRSQKSEVKGDVADVHAARDAAVNEKGYLRSSASSAVGFEAEVRGQEAEGRGEEAEVGRDGAGALRLEARLAYLFRAVVSVLWRAAIMLVVAAALFYPYTRHYATAYGGIQMWEGATTAIPDYLVVHGFFLALSVIYLASEVVVQLRERQTPGWLRELLPWLAAAGLILLGAGWLLGVRVWIIALPMLIVAVLLAVGRAVPPVRRFGLLLLALALAITMGVEVVRLKDDLGRMNTVFKFYLQAWTLFGVTAAYGLATWAPRALSWRPGWRRLAWGVTVVLFIGAMLYPPFAARAKVKDRFSAEDSPRGLDGMAYMDKAAYAENGRDLYLADDKAAMQWLLHNVQGSPVILEGQVPEYRWGSRFSIYTGLPTVQGWNWHQRQQRSVVPDIEVTRRVNQVQELYTTTDLARVRSLLDTYNVQYIIVGGLERAYYPPEGLAKFDTLVDQGYLEPVYRGGAVTIYEVVGRATPAERGAPTFVGPQAVPTPTESPLPTPAPFESPQQ